MEKIIASIYEGNSILAENVTTWIQINTSPTGSKSWHGHFTLADFWSEGNPSYKLVTIDGRKGDFILSEWTIKGNITYISFKGSGPFE
jgi:hypothetical protein